METKRFTDDEQIRRIWDIEDIKSLMHRRVFLQTGDRRDGIRPSLGPHRRDRLGPLLRLHEGL